MNEQILEICSHDSDDRELHQHLVGFGCKLERGYQPAIAPIESSLYVHNYECHRSAKRDGMKQQEVSKCLGTIAAQWDCGRFHFLFLALFLALFSTISSGRVRLQDSPVCDTACVGKGAFGAITEGKVAG